MLLLNGLSNRISKRCSGAWSVEVDLPGIYTFRLRRWPEELPIPLEAVVSDKCASNLDAPEERRAVALHPKSAHISISGIVVDTAVKPGMEEAVIEVELPQSTTSDLKAWFTMEDDEQMCAYYVVVERLSAD